MELRSEKLKYLEAHKQSIETALKKNENEYLVKKATLNRQYRTCLSLIRDVQGIFEGTDSPGSCKPVKL